MENYDLINKQKHIEHLTPKIKDLLNDLKIFLEIIENDKSFDESNHLKLAVELQRTFIISRLL